MTITTYKDIDKYNFKKEGNNLLIKNISSFIKPCHTHV